MNSILSSLAFSLTFFALCVGKLSSTKQIRFMGLLLLIADRKSQKSPDLVRSGNAIVSWPLSIKQPIELAVICAVFFFILSSLNDQTLWLFELIF